MGKEKKKSDWENLQEMLSQDADAPQNVDDWSADETPIAPVVEAEAEVEKSVAKAPVAKTKRACGEKKTKATTKTRKKTAPKTDKIDAALAAPVADAPQDAETVDLTVAETEKAPKKRRRTTKKVEQNETELVKNVLKLESETKAKKRARAQAAEANPFVGLLSQIERVAQDEASVEETDEASVEVEEVEAAVETPETVEVEVVETADSGDFFADFFADSNVEELEISWGRSRADEAETIVEEPVVAPEPEAVAEETDEAETEPEPVAEDAAPRRRERRRRRRDDRAPREETPALDASDDVKPDVDLNDLEAFFATDSEDEGVGFAPRRESKKAEKVAQDEKPERVEKARPVETVERPTVCDGAFDADEDDEARSKRKRRRRRNGRRAFEDDLETSTFDAEPVESAPEVVAESEVEPETFEPERAPRERRRRERRPRREREVDFETVEPDAAETNDERRVDAPERVLPSWSDAISHVVRFNMSRRVNRRR
ncbi:MAG: hypothetical protein IJE77_06825 [Thermoguttaceae bacterium]|nr:hypothetical protein [Thermoguttaceae bacterium]MBQ9798443.1 hypothetical protein [Thermoguttaceae bacterium]